MTRSLQIVALEPFYGGSHRQWLDGLKKYSSHQIEIFSLPGRLWKWRMNGAAVTFAKRVNELQSPPDLFLATDILDVATFRGLLPDSFKKVPLMTYFHENQFAYPWRTKEKPLLHDVQSVKHFDMQYLFKNYTSALSSDFCFFNSKYNLESFLSELKEMLGKLPDYTHPEDVEKLREKFAVLPLGIELPPTTPPRTGNKIIWNHRWEFDKNPEEFFAILRELKKENANFKLSLLGTRAQKHPAIFEAAREEFVEEIDVFESLPTREEYLNELSTGTVALTTSHQEFFGISVIEAINAGNIPLLPKRLSYPEIIPRKFHSTFLYNDQKEALKKLQDFLQKPTNYHRQLQELQDSIQQYHWEGVIEKYNKELSLNSVFES